MNILTLNQQLYSQVVQQAVQTLRNGGLLIFPTETTYGLGADATNAAAVEKLMQYKTKRTGKALSIAVSDQAMAEQYVELNQTARGVYQKFLPGPVTVISVGRHRVATGVESERGTLGVRIPDYQLVRDIVTALGRPITATSANASNEKRPYTLQDIWDNTSAKQQSLIDLAIDAGELPHNEPSTVIDTTLDTYSVVRQGTIQFFESEIFTSESVERTLEIGQRLIGRYRNVITTQPLVFALEGEMGAGKTHLVKGMAHGLGISQNVTSPTYTVMQEYPFRTEGVELPFLHLDAWRIEGVDELKALELEQYAQQNAVIALEWANTQPEMLEQLFATARLVWIKLEYGDTPEQRRITLSERPKESA